METFEEITDRCIMSMRSWDDPDFPANSDSILIGLSNPDDYHWRRPREITRRPPKFLLDGVGCIDIAQGELGDWWFISAAAILATRHKLFAQVVPLKQNFISEYVGAFRFNFWQFGEWKEVIVDDRLPVNEEGELLYCRNRSHPNEFWAPLLEKAYAKLNGCYHAISHGQVTDALVDLTGGVPEVFNLRREEDLPDELFDIINSAYKAGALMGTNIWNDTGKTTEEKMWSGLYKGHNYSITKVMETRIQGWSVKLLRLRNPWGKADWSGAWSEKSQEWKSVPDDAKDNLELVAEEEGEFWMTFEDVKKNFSSLYIIHLGPATFARLKVPKDSIKWHCAEHHGRWVKGVNAGGNGVVSPQRLYYRNPQYFFTMVRPDSGDLNVARECTVLISLLLKDVRKKRTSRAIQKLIVDFDVYLLRKGVPEALDHVTLHERAIIRKKFSTTSPVREVVSRLSVDAGTYLVIPSTSKADQEAPFILRLFTYYPAETVEIKEVTSIIEDVEPVPRPIGELTSDLFGEFAGPDLVVDARDMRAILNVLSKKAFGETSTFSVEACRSLVSMMDEENTGVMDFEQTAKLWDEILYLKKLFKKFDKDCSGSIDTWELREVFKTVGFSMGFPLVATLAVKYGGKERTLFFEDFVLCITKTTRIFNHFQMFCEKTKDEAKMDLETVQTRLD